MDDAVDAMSFLSNLKHTTGGNGDLQIYQYDRLYNVAPSFAKRLLKPAVCYLHFVVNDR